MATSFFEKLTGASNEEEVEITETTPTKKPAKKQKTTKKKKTIKKRSLDLPQPKAEKVRQESEVIEPQTQKKSIKKTMPKKEKPSAAKAVEDKEKDWLEEAEGEEGQLTIDVYQTDADIVVKSTIAGVNPEDIDVSITNDMVTIRGKRVKDERVEAENYYYQELYWGAFSRSVILPVEVDADKAKASIKNGILTIKLPKSEKTKTKKITVRTTE